MLSDESNETSNGSQPTDGTDHGVGLIVANTETQIETLAETLAEKKSIFEKGRKLFQFSSIDRIAGKQI